MASGPRETAQSEDSCRPGASIWQGILLRLGLALFGLATVLAACDRAQVEVLNLLPGLREALAKTGEPLYYSTDWHLNPAGHRAVASILEEIVP